MLDGADDVVDDDDDAYYDDFRYDLPGQPEQLVVKSGQMRL